MKEDGIDAVVVGDEETHGAGVCVHRETGCGMVLQSRVAVSGTDWIRSRVVFRDGRPSMHSCSSRPGCAGRSRGRGCWGALDPEKIAASANALACFDGLVDLADESAGDASHGPSRESAKKPLTEEGGCDLFTSFSPTTHFLTTCPSRSKSAKTSLSIAPSAA